MADRDKIQQVFFNLVSNSIKYGKKSGTTRVRFFDMNENILVEVKLQNTGGTAETKLAYEMWTLQYACAPSNLYEKAYLI